MGKSLKVGDKQVVEKIDFTLPRGAVITGRVLDEYGEPIADVQVSALRNQFTASGARPVNAGRIASTNDIGEFRLFGISPGQYLSVGVLSRIHDEHWNDNRRFVGIRRHLLPGNGQSRRRPEAHDWTRRKRVRRHVDARPDSDRSRQRHGFRRPGTTIEAGIRHVDAP